MPHRIALVGGTGPEGRGLATRFALAGHTVVLGSRDAARGAEVGAELAEALAPHGVDGRVSGSDNDSAVADADIVVIVVPYTAHRPTLEGLRDALAGKLVVDAVVPVRFEKGPRPIDVEAGSATEEAASILPDSTVLGAFHNLPAEVLLDPTGHLESDILVTGANGEAKDTVMALAEQIEGCRAVDAGPNRYSRFVEGLTTLGIGINGRYKAHGAVKITGIPDRP
jgi:NADPH-dependent F420 reductase